MKQLFFILVFSCFINKGMAQPLPGTYSYSSKVEGNPPKGEENNGPSGTLSLLKMEGTKYRFWLDITIGWPSYNQGQLDGTVNFKKDTAYFEISFEDEGYPCILHFKRKVNSILIKSNASSYNCGFGEGVLADGDYTRDKKQPALNNAWLKDQYSQSSFFIIAAKKTTVYQDENGLRPYPPGVYLVKGEKLPNLDERLNTIYTEYINAAGKFIYGWVKKKDVKLLDFGE